METRNASQIATGKFFFQLRDYTPIPLLILLFIYAKPTVASATLGMLLIFFGELMRVYSVAFIGSISRTRKDRTGSNLITSGPFSYVRNPLYVANFIIVLGVTVYGAASGIILLTVLLFTLQYHYIVAYEEDILVGSFGEEYENYRKEVPAWFPEKLPGIKDLEWPDSFSKAIRSERRTMTAIVAIIAVLAIFGA